MLSVSHGERRVHPNVILAVLSLAGLAYAMLSSAVIPALPTIQRDLHTTETGVAWLLTGYLLSASVATSIIGRLGDMYGKERLLLYTLMVLAAGTLLGALSHSLFVLIIARVIQGSGGGIFPLAFAITRDEFPRERVAGSIGLMSSILGVGAGFGIVIGGLIVEHLTWQWLFWLPLFITLIAAFFTWRFIPESPVRVPGKVNWLAAALMSVGICSVLIAVSQTTTWGWGSPKTLALLLIGFLIIAAWIYVEVHSREPLIDMSMMRIRGVWTTNLTAFLLGAGMYSSFIIFPEFAQLAKSTGFGFGASVVDSGLYLLPSALAMGLLGSFAGRFARRFGSKMALVIGSGITASAFLWFAAVHSRPIDMLHQLRAARRGDWACVRGTGESRRAGGPASPDRRRQRHEHGDAHPGRCARGPDCRHPDRRQHPSRHTRADGLHRVLPARRRIPGRLPAGVASRPRHATDRGSRRRTRAPGRGRARLDPGSRLARI